MARNFLEIRSDLKTPVLMDLVKSHKIIHALDDKAMLFMKVACTIFAKNRGRGTVLCK